MKRSYKKLLLFQVIIFLILLLNSVTLRALSDYKMLALLIISLFSFKLFLGFEKDRNRYTKDIIFEIIIFSLAFFLLYYLFGLLCGFARVENYYTIYALLSIIIPNILIIVAKEVLRYMMIRKAEGCNAAYVFNVILFIFLDITNVIKLSSTTEAFKFLSLALLPAISTNILCNYLAKRVGYKASIVYLITMTLYQYLLPIVPNPNEYVVSIIRFLLPLALLWKLLLFFKEEKDEFISRDYHKKRVLAYVVPLILIIIIVYFTSGYFRYFTLAIASGSMEPVISKGDVVVIKKIGNKKGNLKKGQIVAYRYHGVIIVHRINKIVKDEDTFCFYTKGDANSEIDNYPISGDMIIGTVGFKIPFIGLPTVWLNEM